MTAGPSASSVRAYIESAYGRGTLTARSGEVHDIGDVSVSPDEGRTLRDLIVVNHVTSTFETGLALGMSTLHICEGLLASEPPGTHAAIDPLQGFLYNDVGLASLEDAGVASMVQYFREPAHLVLPRLLGDGRRFDLGFVDDGHHFEDAFIDCFYALQLLRPGGLLVVDDVWMPAIDLVVRYLVTNLGCTRVESVRPRDFQETLRCFAHPRRRPRWLKPGAGAQMAILRTPAGWTKTERLLGIEATPEVLSTAAIERPWERFIGRPWDSFVPFGAPLPGWLRRLRELFARYDLDT